jgi:hypothetical protein
VRSAEADVKDLQNLIRRHRELRNEEEIIANNDPSSSMSRSKSRVTDNGVISGCSVVKSPSKQLVDNNVSQQQHNPPMTTVVSSPPSTLPVSAHVSSKSKQSSVGRIAAANIAGKSTVIDDAVLVSGTVPNAIMSNANLNNEVTVVSDAFIVVKQPVTAANNSGPVDQTVVDDAQLILAAAAAVVPNGSGENGNEHTVVDDVMFIQPPAVTCGAMPDAVPASHSQTVVDDAMLMVNYPNNGAAIQPLIEETVVDEALLVNNDATVVDEAELVQHRAVQNGKSS